MEVSTTYNTWGIVINIFELAITFYGLIQTSVFIRACLMERVYHRTFQSWFMITTVNYLATILSHCTGILYDFGLLSFTAYGRTINYYCVRAAWMFSSNGILFATTIAIERLVAYTFKHQYDRVYSNFPWFSLTLYILQTVISTWCTLYFVNEREYIYEDIMYAALGLALLIICILSTIMVHESRKRVVGLHQKFIQNHNRKASIFFFLYLVFLLFVKLGGLQLYTLAANYFGTYIADCITGVYVTMAMITTQLLIMTWCRQIGRAALAIVRLNNTVNAIIVQSASSKQKRIVQETEAHFKDLFTTWNAPIRPRMIGKLNRILPK